ncbi:MAG: hypothetical protein ABIK73_08675 [candidate division WOR-3 bacterium]
MRKLLILFFLLIIIVVVSAEECSVNDSFSVKTSAWVSGAGNAYGYVYTGSTIRKTGTNFVSYAEILPAYAPPSYSFTAYCSNGQTASFSTNLVQGTLIAKINYNNSEYKVNILFTYTGNKFWIYKNVYKNGVADDNYWFEVPTGTDWAVESVRIRPLSIPSSVCNSQGGVASVGDYTSTAVVYMAGAGSLFPSEADKEAIGFAYYSAGSGYYYGLLLSTYNANWYYLRSTNTLTFNITYSYNNGLYTLALIKSGQDTSTITIYVNDAEVINNTTLLNTFNFSAFGKIKAELYLFGRSVKEVLDYNKNLTCIKKEEEGSLGDVFVCVKSVSGIPIKKYFLTENITNNTYTVSDGCIKLNYLLGLSNVQFIVDPLFLADLRENITLTTIMPGYNYITLNNYYYNINIIAKFINVLGNALPLGCSYTVNGELIPDKSQSIGTFAVAGGFFDNVSLQLPAGNYNLTVKTRIMGISREKQVSLTLLDNEYNKKIIVAFHIIGENVTIESYNTSMLYIQIVDANYAPVAGAKVSVCEENKAICVDYTTDGNGLAKHEVELGKTYKIKVYYADKLKAEKIVTALNSFENIVIAIAISEEERMKESEEQNITVSDNQKIVSISFNILQNPAVLGLIIVLGLAIVAATNAGERIGLITFVAALGVFTYVIPLLPQVIFVVVAIVAMILFSWKIVGRLVGGGEE